MQRRCTGCAARPSGSGCGASRPSRSCAAARRVGAAAARPRRARAHGAGGARGAGDAARGSAPRTRPCARRARGTAAGGARARRGGRAARAVAARRRARQRARRRRGARPSRVGAARRRRGRAGSRWSSVRARRGSAASSSSSAAIRPSSSRQLPVVVEGGAALVHGAGGDAGGHRLRPGARRALVRGRDGRGGAARAARRGAGRSPPRLDALRRRAEAPIPDGAVLPRARSRRGPLGRDRRAARARARRSGFPLRGSTSCRASTQVRRAPASSATALRRLGAAEVELRQALSEAAERASAIDVELGAHRGRGATRPGGGSPRRAPGAARRATTATSSPSARSVSSGGVSRSAR